MNNMAKVVKVKRNPDGDITDVVLENGNVYSIDEARMMAEDGLLEYDEPYLLKKSGELAADNQD